MTLPYVSAIHIYPIKSMGGISLKEAQIGMRGLQHDRRYMLITEGGQFLTQRQIPALGHFQLRYSDDGMSFWVDFMGDTIQIPLQLGPQSQPCEATIWDDRVAVIQAPKRLNQWFSEKLHRPVRLVYLPDDAARPVPKKHQPQSMESMHVSLADGFPVLIISEASLQELNHRITQENPDQSPMEMMRFRPNIVLGGIQAHGEDELGVFTLGTAKLQVAKPCSRCILTTINPTSLERGNEPLKTLGTYRKVDNKILFGANVLCLQSGKIVCHN